MFLKSTLAGIVCLLISINSVANQKTDVVTLYNGDKITGEIKEMSAGLLHLSTDYANTIKIEWQQIAHLDSRYNFELRLTSTERLYGNVAKAEKNGELQFTSISDIRSIALLDVTEMRPIEDSFIERLDYTLGANFQIEPELRTNRIDASIDYEDQATRTNINGQVAETVTRTTETDSGDTLTESTSSASVKFEHQRWTDRSALYRTVTSSYEMNEALGNDGRFSLGLGLGRYFIDRPGMRLNASAGLQGVLEKDTLQSSLNNNDARLMLQTTTTESEVEGNTRSLESFINASWHVYEFGDNDMDITISGNVYPSLSESGRVRANLQTIVAWEVYNDLYWTLSATADFDSESDASIIEGQPPSTEIPQDTPISSFDYNVTMGISWRP